MATRHDEGRVFRSGHRNVMLNFRSSPDSEFGFYGYSFHEAAQALAERLSNRRYSDLEALPIVFLHRHTIELYLKAILLLGNQLLATDGKNLLEDQLKAVLHSHRLTPFLSHLKTIFEATSAEWYFPDTPELETFGHLKSILHDLERVDADSYAFRYPTTKDGHGSVPPQFEFDLTACVTLLDQLVVNLDAALTHLEVTWDNVCDALSEYNRS